MRVSADLSGSSVRFEGLIEHRGGKMPVAISVSQNRDFPSQGLDLQPSGETSLSETFAVLGKAGVETDQKTRQCEDQTAEVSLRGNRRTLEERRAQ
jgi:hypothetical protein